VFVLFVFVVEQIIPCLLFCSLFVVDEQIVLCYCFCSLSLNKLSCVSCCFCSLFVVEQIILIFVVIAVGRYCCATNCSMFVAYDVEHIFA
jgi:hypothetical protein